MTPHENEDVRRLKRAWRWYGYVVVAYGVAAAAYVVMVIVRIAC